MEEETAMKRLWVLAVLAVSLAAASPAMADSFTFNVDYCTTPCLGGVPASNNGGTVTVTQFATNIVDVTVTLSGVIFHGALQSFAFNISGNPTLTQVASLTTSGQLTIVDGGGGTWTLVQPAGNTDGAGSTFGYALECTTGKGNAC